MNEQLIKQLDQFLNTARLRQKDFKNGLSDEVKKDIAIDFQSKILNILDYAYTNFPITKQKLNQHYPRPDPNQKEEDYFAAKVENKGPVPESLKNFLSHCFQINLKYNQAISYIISKVKHEKPNEFGSYGNPRVSGRLKSTESQPIKVNPDGSINIGGVIKVSGSVFLSNVQIKSKTGITEIDFLELSGGKFEGDVIILKDGERRRFIDWTDDCIKICEEIIYFLKSRDD